MAPLIGTGWHGVVEVCRLDLILDVPLAHRTTIVVCLLEQPVNISDYSWQWKFFSMLLFVCFFLIFATSPDPRSVPWWDLRWRSRCSGASPFHANMIVRQNYQKYPRCLIFNFKNSRCLILNFKSQTFKMFDCHCVRTLPPPSIKLVLAVSPQWLL